MPKIKDTSEFSVTVVASKEGYKTVSTTEKVKVNKANGSLILSSTSGTIEYPNSTTITVSGNTGTLSAVSNNTNIATVSVSGNTVTVKPGTTAGKATITVISAAATNYNAKSATYIATVNNGTISLSATPYSGTYDGKAHNAITKVTVTPSDAKIEYSTNGTSYSTTMPTITNTSSFTVTVRASKAGYKTQSTTQTVKVNKAAGTLTLSATSGTLTYPTSTSFTISGNTGTLSVSSNNTNIATAGISGNTVTVKPGTTAGSATITVTSAEASNYTAKKATYTVTVKPQTVSPTQSGVSYYADVDNDGTIDGVIFEDFRIGGSGSWGGRSYTVATVSDTKTYYVSKTNCEGPFGPKDVITSTGTGNNRFYIMALKDVDGKQNGTGYTWDNAKALGKDGWVLPSVNEWTAFASALKIDTSNYNGYGLSNNYWSSTAEGGRTAYYIRFNAGEISYMRSNAMGLFGTYNYTSGRVARTF